MKPPAPHPANHWGLFADDPNSELLDLVTGEAWDQAVEAARRLRLATQSADERRRSKAEVNKAPNENAMYPGHSWGPFANDPWSSILDVVQGEAWDRAVAAARRHRLAIQ